MAIFTAIATALVTAYTGAAIVAGTWAAFAVSVVATGLAMVTSRLINGSGSRGGGGTQDQGVKVQLPPATDNKVPILYGRAFQQAAVTDAVLSSSDFTTNDTMTYVLTLSERTQTGSVTFNDVYYNDQKLNFAADGFTVESSTTSDGTTSTTLANLVKVYVYNGGSGSAYNLGIGGGAVPGVNAYDLVGSTSTYQMTDLVFAVVQLTYSQEKNVTGLPTMIFDMENTIKNPADVWYDYMTSTRYGGGFAEEDLDLPSLTALETLSDEIPANQFQNDGTTPLVQPRYEINGVINTGDTIKNNLDRINIASSSWTTFDHKSGKWKVVANTTGTAVMNFNDDNIIGEITVTATNLEDLYNQVEVAYANRGTRDQSDYYKASIDPAAMNDLEPVNILRMRVDMVNNKVHAGRIGNIELNQSRVDLVITFQADYSALQVEAGDIISVTNPIYDFNAKLFRVTRVRETEGDDGHLAAEISALEYNASIYADLELVDGDDKPVSDIPTAGSSTALPAPSAPIITNSYETANIPNFTIQTTISTATSPVNLIEWFYSSTSTSGFVYLDNERSTTDNFVAGDTITDVITKLYDGGTWYFKARTGVSGRYSDFSTASAAFTWAPTPAGANNGTIANSTNSVYAENIAINSINDVDYYVAVVPTGTIGSYSDVQADPQLTWNATTNKLYTNNWEVSTVTNLVYAMYQSTATQTISTSTDAVQMTLNITDFENDIARTGGTITLNGPGLYNLQWSGQFENPLAGAHNAYIWLRQNGVDVPNSTGVVTIPAKHGSTNGATIAGWNYFIQTTATNETIQLYWGADDNGIALQYIPPGSNPTRPATASLIVTVDKMKD